MTGSFELKLGHPRIPELAFLRVLEPQTSSRLWDLGSLGVAEAVWQNAVAQTSFQFWRLLCDLVQVANLSEPAFPQLLAIIINSSRIIIIISSNSSRKIWKVGIIQS